VARTRLVEGVRRGRRRPDREPGFPGGRTRRGIEGVGEPRFPPQGPLVTNLPARNLNFTGRGEVLERLRAQLRGQPGAVVTQAEAVHGLGGVGKTQLALEFAHRYQADYEVIWWIAAEQPASVTAELAALAQELGIQQAADQAEMVTTLFRELRGRRGWLLVYDNAERPHRLTGLLPPGGDGRVLVTSRYGAWGRLGSTLRLDVLPREESVAFLARRTGTTDEASLDALAELLGDLPLALEEAAAYLEETGVGLDEYLELVRGRTRELFSLGQPAVDENEDGDQRRVATVWSLSLDRVRVEAPAAEALLSLCAFLAPEIPRGLPGEQPRVLPDELAQAVGDALVYNRMLAVVGRYSLATVSPAVVEIHRLVQAVIQARLGEDGERRWVETAVGLLRDSFPNDSWEVATWPTCEQMLPHALAAAGHAERLRVAGEQVGWLLGRASTYLHGRGQYRQARPIAERALAVTEAALGPTDPKVAWRRDTLGNVLRNLGDLEGARVQLERALEIGEATLGPDHPDVAARRNNLGNVLRNLGHLAGARVQLERALETGEAALGPDHPTVAAYRGNLGSVLQDLGDLAGARAQLERALAVGEATLGPDHPTVAVRRSNLGGVLEDLGDLAGARAQYERALAISEAALGPDHPHVATIRGNLRGVLQALQEASPEEPTSAF
jgi:tetratricopeptide (TPR) repeat protein